MWYLDLCIWIRLAFGTHSEGAILKIFFFKTLCLYNLANLIYSLKRKCILFESKKNKNISFPQFFNSWPTIIEKIWCPTANHPLNLKKGN